MRIVLADANEERGRWWERQQASADEWGERWRKQDGENIAHERGASSMSDAYVGHEWV